MDKICIVKRRKRIGELAYQEAVGASDSALARPELENVSCAFVNGASGVRIQDSLPSAMPGNIDQKLSVQLSPFSPRTLERCGSMQPAEAYDPEVLARGNEGKYVFNFLFKKVHDVRMLSPKDVCIMLKVSRCFLTNLVRLGKIDSYKLGRLRRFLLDDILTYLGENKDTPETAHSPKMRKTDQRD
jgi:excisionase family DNA binding protein